MSISIAENKSQPANSKHANNKEKVNIFENIKLYLFYLEECINKIKRQTGKKCKICGIKIINF